MSTVSGKNFRVGHVAVPLFLAVQSGVAFGGTDTVAIEDIGPTEEMLRTTPSDEGKISDGDESVVDKVFVYLDGCPLVMLDGDGPSGTDVTMIDRDSDASQREDCIPSYDATSSLPLSAGMELTGVSQDSGLLVQLWQDKPQRDADGVLIETEGPSVLVVEIASLLPETTMLMGEGVPLDDPHRRSYETADGRFNIPASVGENSNLLVPASATGGAGGTGGSNGLQRVGGHSGGFGGGGGGGGGSDNGAGNYGLAGGNASVAPVPIPGALGLLGAGLVTIGGLIGLRRRRALV